MKPRDLRHLLEKAAKILVTIQKHGPDVDCSIDETKGEHGQVVIDLKETRLGWDLIKQLGKELESKGYSFVETKSPWLGTTTYRGRSGDKPTVIISVPITKDRLAINEVIPDRDFSFAQP